MELLKLKQKRVNFRPNTFEGKVSKLKDGTE